MPHARQGRGENQNDKLSEASGRCARGTLLVAYGSRKIEFVKSQLGLVLLLLQLGQLATYPCRRGNYVHNP